MRNRSIVALALLLLALAAAGCGLSSLSPTKTNMFEGNAADDFARRVKAKLGVEDLNVGRIDIRRDSISTVVQDPATPDNFDEYVLDQTGFKEPKPVDHKLVGFALKDVALNLVPEVCRKAAEKSKIEDGKCDSISVDFQSPRWTRTKEENDRIAAEKTKEREKKIRAGTYDGWEPSDLVVTWRVYIKGPRGAKDYWVDAKGNVFDYQ